MSFVGWNYHEIIVALENMVEIKNASRDLYLPSLISKAVTQSAKENLDNNTVLENLNRLARDHLATKIKNYRVLTSLSLPLSPWSLVSTSQSHSAELRFSTSRRDRRWFA